MHFIITLSKCIANAATKYMIYTASLQHAHSVGASQPRPLCKRQAAALSLCMFNIIAAALYFRRLHRIHSVAGDCTARIFSICIFGRCGIAVTTPLMDDRGYTHMLK